MNNTTVCYRSPGRSERFATLALSAVPQILYTLLSWRHSGSHEPRTSDPCDARRAEDRKILRGDSRLPARIRCPTNIPDEAVWLNLGRGQQIHLVYVDGFEVSPFEREFGRHVAVYYPRAQFDALKARSSSMARS